MQRHKVNAWFEAFVPIHVYKEDKDDVLSKWNLLKTGMLYCAVEVEYVSQQLR